MQRRLRPAVYRPRAGQSDAFAANAFTALPRDPACFNDRLTSTGGPAPQNPHTLVVRWTGFSNFELAYEGKIILLDAYFDRGRDYPPLGFAAADVRKADAIIIGHGHYDHMSDAASVGIRTGAPLVGAALTTDVLKSEQVPPSQIKTVTGKGGELLIRRLYRAADPGAAWTAGQARHAGAGRGLQFAAAEAGCRAEAEEKAIAARGTFDPRVSPRTIAYLITLDDGFRIMYRDSGGHVTDYEKAAMEKLGGVDLALVGLSADILNVPTEQQALEHVRSISPTSSCRPIMTARCRGICRSGARPSRSSRRSRTPIPALSRFRGYREPVCFKRNQHPERP